MNRFLKLHVLALVAVTTPACLDSGSEALDSSEQGMTGQVPGKGRVHTIAGAKPTLDTAPAQRQPRSAGRVIEGPRKDARAAAAANLAGQDAQGSLDRNALTARGQVIESDEKKLLPGGHAEDPGLDASWPPGTSGEEDELHTLAGGPDAFGYTFVSSHDPGGPGFFWTDISSTGALVYLSDDSYFHPIDLPFSFQFYGASYNQVTIASNGAVYFDGNAYLGHINAPIPGPSGFDVDRFIAGYWDDLDPSAGGGVYTEVRGAAPNRRLIVQWNDVPHYLSSDAVTMQIILFEGSNNVLLQYLDPSLEAGGEATVGIQGSSSVGLQVLHNVPGLTAGSSICFVPPGGSSASCTRNGPDGGGYTFTDSTQPGSPPFFWQDVTGGNYVPLGDDSIIHSIPLPFAFNFYGTSHDHITVGSNGIVYFDTAYLGYNNTPIPGPTPEGVDRFIAAYWDDLNPNAGGAVYYQVRGTAPNRRVIVQWDEVPHYASSDKVKVQAILFEGAGNIVMQYLNPSLEAGSGATVGIQASNTVGLQYALDEAALSPGLAVCYTPPGGTSAGCRVNGPDPGGYTVTDSNQAGSPQFYWREISGTGTRLFLTDESYFYPISLPFTFHFYGAGQTNITVGSNGTIHFDNAYQGYVNAPIPAPNPNGINRFIAAYWDDLDPNGGGAVYYQVEGDAPNRRLIVEWKDIPHYQSADRVSLQAILFEGTNNILVQYLTPSARAGRGTTVGLQNATNVGLQYSFDEAVLTDRLAVCFSPPGGNSTGCRMANWLSRKGTGSAQEGWEYYAAIGAPRTFAQWKLQHGFDGRPDVNARYYNDFDLGLARDMHCQKIGTDLACYVTNYGIAPGGPAQPAINNAINRRNPLATVAMVHVDWIDGQANDVRFYVYDGNGNLIPQVALDSEGPKAVPQLCLPCHGGFYDAAANAVHGASFLPFDVFSYIFSDVRSDFSLSAQQESFRQLNAMVRDTHPNQPIIDLIDGTYPGGVYNPGSTAQNTYVPPGWAGNPALYNTVIKPACRGCHAAQGFDLTHASHLFAAESSVCVTHQMPHAEKPFKNFWTSTAPHLPTFLASAMGWSSCSP